MPVGGGIETPSTLWKDQGRYIPVAAAQAPPLQIGGAAGPPKTIFSLFLTKTTRHPFFT